MSWKIEKKILYKYYLIQKYNSNYSYRYNYKKIVNDDKSKFQISPISSMLTFISFMLNFNEVTHLQ